MGIVTVICIVIVLLVFSVWGALKIIECLQKSENEAGSDSQNVDMN